jgi:hypothetical protein
MDESLRQNRGLLPYREQTARSAEKICHTVDEIKGGKLAWLAYLANAQKKGHPCGWPVGEAQTVWQRYSAAIASGS